MKTGALGLNRRRFGAAMLGAAAAAALPTGRGGAEMAETRPTTRVFLAGARRGVDAPGVARAVNETVEAMGGLSWLSRGDSVYIKPACNSGNSYPATTSPAGLAALVRALKDRGAGPVIVADTAGIQFVKLTPTGLRGSTRRLMAQNGLARAAVEAGAELYFPEEEGWGAFVEEEPQGTSWKRPLMMPRRLHEVDHVVLMPRVSRHALAGSTLGYKSAVGYWRTDTRLEYHRDAATLQEKTAESATVPSLRDKQRLVLTVADQLQTTFGPDRGHNLAPEDGLVFASASLLAHDLLALAFLLHGRTLTPPRLTRAVYRDPYTSQAAVEMGNRVVVYMLGGAREMARAQRLDNPPLATVWDDRVLRRACELAGGPPALELVPVGEAVSLPLRQRLSEMTTPPA
jgi:uncharacterized protein (DUF362 family)